MKCSSCSVQAEIEAGKYAHVRYEDTPCASCTLAEGGYTVAFDETRLLDPDVGYTGADRTDTNEGDRLLPLSVMSALTAGLLRMGPRARDVVCMRCQGLLYREIAEKLGATVAAVEKSHARAMGKWPMLKALFPVKTAKRIRRKNGSGRVRGTGIQKKGVKGPERMKRGK